MKMSKKTKIFGFIATLILVLSVSYVGFRYIAFGEGNSDSLVMGDPVDVNVVLTLQDLAAGLTTRPEVADDSGNSSTDPNATAAPVTTPIPLPEMPECTTGEDKYTEKNPFMVLEIVPALNEQVMAWWNAESAPLSDIELTYRISTANKRSIEEYYRNAPSDAEPLMKYTSFKVWNPNVNVDDKDDYNGVQTIREHVEDLYATVQESDSDDVKRSVKDKIEKFVEEKCYTTLPIYSTTKLFTIETGDAFGEGDSFKDVPELALKDKYNWSVQATSNKVKKSGYLVRSTSGTGKFLPQLWDKSVSVSNSPYDNRYCWEFTTQKPDGVCYDSQVSSDSNYLNNNYNSIPIGSYITVDNWSFPVLKYVYTCLKNNDLMKYALLNPYVNTDHWELKDQEQIDVEKKNIFKVVTVTPDQINELEKYDTETTLDYVERADMIYLNSLNPNTDSQQFQVTRFCSAYVDNYVETTNADGTVTATANSSVDQNRYATYNNTGDIEWSICAKIIKKLSTYITFPMLVNSTLYNVCNTENLSMKCFVDNNGYWQSRNSCSSICNAAKVYFIASEFNLVARKNELPEGLTEEEQSQYSYYLSSLSEIYNSDGLYKGERTFMDDIYPKIKQIKLTNPNGTCQYTGYYERPESSDNKKSYYIWGEYTFFPVNYESENTKAGNENSIKDNTWTYSMRRDYGYLETFAFNEGSGKHTTETRPQNRDKFSGTDGDRSMIEKHFQNVVGQPVNQSIFTTDGTPFWNIFSSLREIITKPNEGSIAMVVKIKDAYKYASKYCKFLDVNKDSADTYDDNDFVTVKFTVSNPKKNKAPGYFYVAEVSEDNVDKDGYYYEGKSNATLKEGYFSMDVYDAKGNDVEPVVSSKDYTLNNPDEATPYIDYDKRGKEIQGYLVEPGKSRTFVVKYKYTHFLGTSTDAGMSGLVIPQINFATKVIRCKETTDDDGKKVLMATAAAKTTYDKLLFRERPLFNLE